MENLGRSTTETWCTDTFREEPHNSSSNGDDIINVAEPGTSDINCNLTEQNVSPATIWNSSSTERFDLIGAKTILTCGIYCICKCPTCGVQAHLCECPHTDMIIARPESSYLQGSLWIPNNTGHDVPHRKTTQYQEFVQVLRALPRNRRPYYRPLTDQENEIRESYNRSSSVVVTASLHINTDLEEDFSTMLLPYPFPIQQMPQLLPQQIIQQHQPNLNPSPLLNPFPIQPMPQISPQQINQHPQITEDLNPGPLLNPIPIQSMPQISPQQINQQPQIAEDLNPGPLLNPIPIQSMPQFLPLQINQHPQIAEGLNPGPLLNPIPIQSMPQILPQQINQHPQIVEELNPGPLLNLIPIQSMPQFLPQQINQHPQIAEELNPDPLLNQIPSQSMPQILSQQINQQPQIAEDLNPGPVLNPIPIQSMPQFLPQQINQHPLVEDINPNLLLNPFPIQPDPQFSPQQIIQHPQITEHFNFVSSFNLLSTQSMPEFVPQQLIHFNHVQYRYQLPQSVPPYTFNQVSVPHFSYYTPRSIVLENNNSQQWRNMNFDEDIMYCYYKNSVVNPNQQVIRPQNALLICHFTLQK